MVTFFLFWIVNKTSIYIYFICKKVLNTIITLLDLENLYLLLRLNLCDIVYKITINRSNYREEKKRLKHSLVIFIGYSEYESFHRVPGQSIGS